MDMTLTTEGSHAMKTISKTLTALAVAATLAVAAVAAPQPAEARDGGAIAAGIIGGLAVGAIVGSAAAHGPYYRPQYDEPYRERYYAPAPVYYGPDCYWARQRIWDGFGWRLRRVRVCD